MKNLVATLSLICTGSYEFSADSAACKIILNGAQVDDQVIYHHDYNIHLTGTYSYRTYARDEFYDLNYTYTTASGSADLKVELIGAENTFAAESSMKSNHASPQLEVKIADHENNTVNVKCEVL